MTATPRATTVPAVVDAIVAAFAAIDDADLEVQDGPRLQKPGKRKVISVGVGNPGIDYESVRDVRTGGWTYTEVYDVKCTLWSWGGTQTRMTDHRANCGALWSAVRTQVDGLGSTFSDQNITVSLSEAAPIIQSVAGEGCACAQDFAVHVVATV